MQSNAFTAAAGVDSQDAKGVLGRMVKAIAAADVTNSSHAPMKAALYSLNSYAPMLDGSDQTPVVIGAGDGVVRFSEHRSMASEFESMTRNLSGSIFAEAQTAALLGAIRSSETLGRFLENTTLPSGRVFPETRLGAQLLEVAKVMHLDTSNHTNMERSAFFTGIGAPVIRLS